MNSKKANQFQYLTYGAKTNAEEVIHLLEHMANHYLISENTIRPTPLCIWGMHGIGKTQLVKDFAKEKGYKFAFLSSAQIEEVGDLIGFPMSVEEDGKKITRYATPEWVPMDEGPGILLIDDFNRCDDRIVRALMNVLQNYEMVSWKIPHNWMIVLTANPDGGDYSVTSLDDAVITRMMHVSMEFDVKAWAKWAEMARINPRGIEFVLTYPEIINTNRTTPRTLVQFFESIRSIPDLKNQLALVQMLAEGSLDRSAATAFTSFINMDLKRLIEPEEILGAGQFSIVAGKISRLIHEKVKRLDILSVIMTRLTNYLLYASETISDRGFRNLSDFIMLDIIPNDLRLNMACELVESDKKELKKLFSIPEIGTLILEKM